MIGKTFSGQASHIPTAFTFMLCGLGYMDETAYVCTGSTCLEPTTKIGKMLESLTKNR
jgi:uncharacterized protein YyaL (SSP411 family)